jgi:PAS domain-containing protein
VTLAGEPTHLGDDVGAMRERKRALDRLTIATLLVVFLAVLVCWFLRILALELAPAARAALAYTLLYWAASQATDRIRRFRGLLVAALALQASAIVFLACMWHLLGGLQSPTLLLAFFLPTMAVGALLRPWHAAACAALAIVSAGLIAVIESPELRWYLFQIGLSPALSSLTPAWPGRPTPFPGVDAQPAYDFVLLEVFSAMEIACAAISASLSVLVRRLEARPGSAREEQDLFRAALLAATTPTALVEEEDGRILLASEGFVKRMLLRGQQEQGTRLFDVMRFAEPGPVRALLHAPGGVLPLCSYAIGAELRVARLEAHPVLHRGWRYACVRVEDVTELSYLDSAIRDLADPVLVVASDGLLRYANPAAEEIFGELYLGLEAAQGLARAGLPEAWWAREDPPFPGVQLEIAGASYRLSSVGVGIGAERLRLLTLRREMATGPRQASGEHR